MAYRQEVADDWRAGLKVGDRIKLKGPSVPTSAEDIEFVITGFDEEGNIKLDFDRSIVRQALERERKKWRFLKK